MAAIAPPEIGNPHVVKTPLLAFLEGNHNKWLQEVRGVLDPAREMTAGIWLRWRAVEYLQAGFQRRFERERRAVFSLHERLTGEQASHLWAGGELVAQLLEGLGHRVGLCQRGEEFSSLALTVMSALEYWCRQVEEALGPVRWGEVPPASRSLFELITYDEAIHRGLDSEALPSGGA
jgi:hypothetical protein